MCTKYKEFYAKTFKARHQNECGKDSCQIPVSTTVDYVNKNHLDNLDKGFKNIIKVARDDKIGEIAKTDHIVGSRLYGKIKGEVHPKIIF